MTTLAISAIFWLVFQWSLEAESQTFRFIGMVVGLVPLVAGEVLNGFFCLFDVDLGEPVWTFLSFFLFYGVVCGLPIFRPWRSQWRNYALPALIFVAGTLLAWYVFLFSMAGPAHT